jgi:VirC1 protein
MSIRRARYRPGGDRRNGNGQTGERLVVDRLAADRMRHLPALLDALAAKEFTLVVLDTAGVDDATTHQVIAAVDLCLIPARPTRLDIEASRRTFRTAIALGKPTAFLLNHCPPTIRSPRAIEAAEGLKTLGVLADPIITSRADFPDAVAAGLGVTEFAPTGKAAIETAALWRCVALPCLKGYPAAPLGGSRGVFRQGACGSCGRSVGEQAQYSCVREVRTLSPALTRSHAAEVKCPALESGAGIEPSGDAQQSL